MSIDSIYNQGFRGAAAAATKKSPLSMACTSGDIMYGATQGAGRQLAYPVSNINMNGVPNVACDTFTSEAAMAGGESVLGSTAMNVGIMAPIMARHTLLHPIKGFEAIKTTNKAFGELVKSGALKNMTSLQQAEVYKNLFKFNQFSSKVVHESLQKTLTKANSAYIRALKAGKLTEAAGKAGEMTAIIENGRKSILPFTKLKTVKQVEGIAKAAGKASAAASTAAAAEATAATARVANAATKSAKAMAYGKNALAWTKSSLKSGGAIGIAVLEGLVEAPEVYTAFSDGGFGEGVKQTTKSTVKVGASVGGWCVGAKAGTLAGAKLGAMIGSAICPGPGSGIGAAIGSVIGHLAGGISGCMIASKGAKAVTGKSYTENKQEQQEMEQNQMQYEQQMMPQYPQQTMPQYTYNQGYTPRLRPLLPPLVENPFNANDLFKLD